MISTIGNEPKLTKRQMEEVVKFGNTSYDKGGRDVLKVIMDTFSGLSGLDDQYTSQCTFALGVLEQVRANLQNVVQNATTEIVEEPKTNILTA